MPSPAITFHALSKTFGHGAKAVPAVNAVTLDIAPQQVYGFLGPNGAGKTTTIRMMLDLVRPTQGKVQILNGDVRRPATLRRVGALVEGPAFYSALSGRENLRVLTRARGLPGNGRVDELLALVDLTAAAHQPAGRYSLGMKQRLGLAAALLHHPEVIILDEPTNGLDPAGIVQMRGLIRDLAVKQGKTVFLSSHLLNEVEQICDRVAIIQHGAIVREGPVATLLAEANRLRLEAAPLATALELVRPHWPVLALAEAAAWVEIPRADIPRLNHLLVTAGVQIYHLAHERQTLEDYFLAVTHHS